MSDIFLYLGICIAGYIAGTAMRSVRDKLNWLGTAQNAAVLLLVFTMGSRIGANENIVRSLGTYGVYALILTLAALFFSVLAVSVVRRILHIDRYGRMSSTASREDPQPETKEHPSGFKIVRVDRMTLFILGFVAAGILTGFFLFQHIFSADTFSSMADLAIRIELCALLAFVGLDMGIKGEIVSNFKAVGVRVLAIPAAVIVGTLCASFLIGLFLPIGARTAMAIGSGLGWYSLAPGILMNAGMVEAGAISFLHNVMRELFSIVLIPLVARKVGYVEACALPGAAAMDTCLPIVVRATNSNIAVYSFISGLTLTMIVPFLVPLFC